MEHSKLLNQKVQLKLMVISLSRIQQQDYSSFSKKSEKKYSKIILHIGWLKKEAHTNISQVGIFLEDSCSSPMPQEIKVIKSIFGHLSEGEEQIDQINFPQKV